MLTAFDQKASTREQASSTSDERISLDKAYEVRHWCHVLDMNHSELVRAVSLVGPSLSALRTYRAKAGPGVRRSPTSP